MSLPRLNLLVEALTSVILRQALQRIEHMHRGLNDSLAHLTYRNSI